MVSGETADGASLAVCLHQVFIKILKGGGQSINYRLFSCIDSFCVCCEWCWMVLGAEG